MTLHPVLEPLLSWPKGPNSDILYGIHMKPSGSRTIIQPNLKIEAFFTLTIEKCDIFTKEIHETENYKKIFETYL